MQWLYLQEVRGENVQHKTMKQCSTASYCHVHAKFKTQYMNFVVKTLVSSGGKWTSLSSEGLKNLY